MTLNALDSIPPGVVVVDQLTANQCEQLYELYQKEWWSKDRTREDVDFLLQHSSFILAVIKKDSLELLAFSRVISDFFKYAYLHDLIVKKSDRSIGIGKFLIHTILQHPIIQQCGRLELMCRREMVPYYEKFGFIVDPPERVTMRRLLDF